MKVSNKQSAAVKNHLTIMQRIARDDKNAALECVNKYGDFVWSVVNNSVQSAEEAEMLVRKVFEDIWRFARRYDSANLTENDFINLVVRHRLCSPAHKH